MLVYPSAIDLSNSTLRYLTRRLSAHRALVGTRWLRLNASRQALLVLAHLRCGDACAQLAAGFGIGIATVFRYIREAVDLLAASVNRTGIRPRLLFYCMPRRSFRAAGKPNAVD